MKSLCDPSVSWKHSTFLGCSGVPTLASDGLTQKGKLEKVSFYVWGGLHVDRKHGR